MLNPEAILNNVPEYLLSRPQWVLWGWRMRGEKLSKVPLQPNQRKAQSNNPKTWNTIERCLETYEQRRDDKQFSGIGFCFHESDQLVGIDLDHCFEPESHALNVLKPWASEIVFRFDNTYQERSPSGDGLHIWCIGEAKRCGKGRPNKGIEVYDYRSPRYFTVTGDKLNSYDLDFLQEDLDWLNAKEMEGPAGVEVAVKSMFLVSDSEEEKVQNALKRISPEDYETWIKVGMSLKSGGMGLDMWDWWSARSNKWVAGVCARKWKTFGQQGRTGLGTIFFLAGCSTNAETA